eukprot:TRINITY_DN2490_c0_g1_i6.p1 TRINITY_DN2490_c0_g1~~TRINITY_DN2490_c0_g1_i6.p1  ORF type:complete len:310 (+),score=32.36 TRINITY_DN2490_c0_g1_i6:76-1005(+)
MVRTIWVVVIMTNLLQEGLTDTTAPTMTGFTCCPSVLDVNHTVRNDGAGGIVSRPGKVTCTVTSPDSDLSSSSFTISKTRDGADFGLAWKSTSGSEGTWEFTADNEFGRERVYTFDLVKLRDEAGNENEYNTSSIKAMGGMTHFTVTNTGAATTPNSCATPPANPTAVPIMSNMTCCQLKVDAQESSVNCQASSDRDVDRLSYRYSITDDSGRSISNGVKSRGGSSGNAEFSIKANTTLTFTKVSLADAVGNTREYGTADIAAMAGTSQIRATNTGAGIIPCAHSTTISSDANQQPTTNNQQPTFAARA